MIKPIDPKVTELLIKVKALADKGVGGEKLNAEALLTKLLKKYNVTIDELEGEAKFEVSFRSDKRGSYRARFVSQIIANVCKEPDAYIFSSRPGLTFARMTKAEYIEASEKLQFYWKYYLENRENHFLAFIQANELWTLTPQKGRAMDADEAARVLALSRGIEHKKLDKKLETLKLKQ